MISLYPHQKDAVGKLESGSILCGGVGSGKSRTAIAYFYTKECKGTISSDGEVEGMKKPKDLYIITTARKRDTHEWDRECVPFLLSTKRELSQDNVKVTVDSWNNIHKYTDVKDCFFIFDEQRVVGYGAWTKSFLKIAKQNRWILLSATPGDTWMDYIPVFIANGFYRNKTEFIKRHVIYSRYAKFPKVDRYIDQRRLIKFRDQITVDMPFKRKSTRHNRDVIVDYNLVNYGLVANDRWNIYTKQPVQEISELCYTMRRVVNSDPSRLQAVLDIMKHHDKVIIFYNFDYELEDLRKICVARDIPYGEWNGHKHEAIPETDIWAYLVQYTAGAEGWNCIKTNAIIFYSQNYSYKVMVQAAGRIDRLNTPYSDLYYYHLKSKASIDVAISRALKNKKKFNEKTFESSFCLA